MTFERTCDMVVVREVMRHPKVYPWITDDDAPPAEEYWPEYHSGLWHVLALDGEELLGLWLLVPQTTVLWDVHTCLLPSAGRDRGRRAARELAEWIWRSTPCRRIVTAVPAYNRAAIAFARAAGMIEHGRNLKCFLKFGKLHDQVLFGLSRPEETCPQQ